VSEKELRVRDELQLAIAIAQGKRSGRACRMAEIEEPRSARVDGANQGSLSKFLAVRRVIDFLSRVSGGCRPTCAQVENRDSGDRENR
jgi:hypothetical protein